MKVATFALDCTLQVHFRTLKISGSSTTHTVGGRAAVVDDLTGDGYADLITDRLAHLASAMPSWDGDKLAAFVAAERALVSAQVRGWRTDSAWAAWQQLGQHTGYGQLLIDEDFAGIEALAGRLLA